MTDLTFEKFPSIKRLNRGCVVTEKIDGTNAQIMFDEYGGILCGSRKREITPDTDNFGFARWAYDNQDALFNVLGEGRHYGEWWGSGIQRRYGKENGDKVFSLFNTGRFGRRDTDEVEGLDVAPVLYAGDFSSESINQVMLALKDSGSIAAKGFMKPEGIVVYHSQINQMFKVTFEHDDTGKSFGA